MIGSGGGAAVAPRNGEGAVDDPMLAPVWAISGTPGAGKTTLAEALAQRSGRTLIRSRDIVQSVDPGAIGDGRLADGPRIAAAFEEMLAVRSGYLILDGMPRTPDQLDLLPPGSLVFSLWCREDVALERISRRGRLDDDPQIAARRWREQAAILEQDRWLREACTYTRQLNTANKNREQVVRGVWAYLTGESGEVY